MEPERTCPFCAKDFSGATCHSSCPMARGCNMIRCPHCGYEYVEEGLIANALKRLFRRASSDQAKVQ